MIKIQHRLKYAQQEISSADTSINADKLPAVFTKRGAEFVRGGINLDYGGGRFDNAAEYLFQERGVFNLVWDPFNRTADHNAAVVAAIKKHDGADTTTCSNVLNVIAEQDARRAVLENIKLMTKRGGRIYITIYDGNRTGRPCETSKGYQLNRKLKDYEQEIKAVFPDAVRRYGMYVIINH